MTCEPVERGIDGGERMRLVRDDIDAYVTALVESTGVARGAPAGSEAG